MFTYSLHCRILPAAVILWFSSGNFLHPSSFAGILKKCLFIWPRQVLVAACGIFVAACRLLVEACMQDLVPQLNPGPLHWERGVLPTGPPGKSHLLELNCKEEMFLLPHLFIYSIIYLYQDGVRDVYFILWVLIQYYNYLFCGSSCLSLIIGCSFWTSS